MRTSHHQGCIGACTSCSAVEWATAQVCARCMHVVKEQQAHKVGVLCSTAVSRYACRGGCM